MTKHWTVLFTASVATLLALFDPASAVRADIFQWEYINPANPGEGKQPSAILAPGGAGVNAVPGANLTFRDLTMGYLIGADLTGAYGEAVILTNADLSQANLTNANIAAYVDENGGHYYSDLSAANLTQTNLTNANFALATLSGANFSQANLTNAHFDEAVLTGANLNGAEVRRAKFTRYNLDFGITAAQLYSTASYQAHDLTGIVLAGNNLTGVNLAGQNLTNVKFHIIFSVATNLAGANLSQSNLTNASFVAATLTGANLTGADVRGANFSQYAPESGYVGTGISAAQLSSTASYQAHDLTGIRLERNNLTEANLAGQNLTGAYFEGATLSNANLSQANLTYASFRFATLTAANLSQANLANANFSGYSFSVYDEILGEVIVVVPGANLAGANLSGADARGANFQYATLAGANTSNLIQSNGHIAGLDLTAGASLLVRDYDGGIPIVVEQHLVTDATGTLRLVFDADPWDSTISFAPGIPVALGGTLDLTFGPGVNVATQSGRTIDLFDWTGVTPTGAFTVSSPYTWNLSQLYTTGEITLTALSTLAGDFNSDGTVDAADYVVWCNGLGTTYTQSDYNVWRAHFGTVSPGIGAGSGAALHSAESLLAAVPEPVSAVLFLVGAAATGFVTARRRMTHIALRL